jgi:activator of 2-hydroxyglutaryl-CoA dehydratase
VRRLEEKLGTDVQIAFDPQIVGALGAALFARDLAQKARATGERHSLTRPSEPQRI